MNEGQNYYVNNNNKEKKGGGIWKILLILVILFIIFLIVWTIVRPSLLSRKSRDEKFEELRVKVCEAATKYAKDNSRLTRSDIGKSVIIKFRELSDANLIEPKIPNPYYEGNFLTNLFKGEGKDRYYSIDTSVRVTMNSDGTTFCEIVDNSVDVTAPELKLNGDAEITLAVGTDFDDPGYIATDDYDGDITDKVVRSGNIPEEKTAGTYELTYAVRDNANNIKNVKRTIKYVEYKDLEPTQASITDTKNPVIQLKGANPYCLEKGSKYVEPGAKAIDNVDGDITDRIAVINKVTGNIVGTFRVEYSVEDSSGNKAIAYRAVTVSTNCGTKKKDTTTTQTETVRTVNNAPEITLVGKDSIIIDKGTNYVDLGATAYDKEDGDITSKLITDTTAVKVNVAGIYKVIYRVTDSAGKTVTKTRVVTVNAPVSGNPSVRFTENKENVTVKTGKGSDSLISAPKAVNENGQSVNVTTYIEDYDTKVKVSKIDWLKDGKYRVIYTALHGNGTVKQEKNMVVTITSSLISVPDSIRIAQRTTNCDLTEKDLTSNGVVVYNFNVADYDKSADKNRTKLEDNAGIACKEGTYKVSYSVYNGETELELKEIEIKIVGNTGGAASAAVKSTAPSKVVVTSNDANPTDVYNKSGVFAPVTQNGITVKYKSTPASGTKIAYFQYSKDCATPEDLKMTCKDSANECDLTVKAEGKITVCVRAVNDKGEAGPWSDPINLYRKAVEISKTAPSKVVVTSNSANQADPYNKAGKWAGGATTTIKINVKATAASGTKIEYFQFSKDCMTPEDKKLICKNNANECELIRKKEGKDTVCVRAVNDKGEAGPWSDPIKVYLDLTKPNTEFTHTWKDGMDDWHNTPNLTVTYKGVDSLSGVDHYEYTYDDVKARSILAKPTSIGENLNIYSESTGSLTVNGNTEPTHTQLYVYVRAVDKAGNVGEWTLNPAYINVDTYKPNAPVLDGIEGNNSESVSINVKAIDTKSLRPSGIGKFVYTLNSGAEKSVTAKALGTITKVDGNGIKMTTDCRFSQRDDSMVRTQTTNPCYRSSEYSGSIVLPTNTATSNMSYSVKIWAVDKAGNRSDGYATTNATVTPAKVPNVKFTHTWNDDGTWENGGNVWHNAKELKVTFEPVANKNLVDHYEYTFDSVYGEDGHNTKAIADSEIKYLHETKNNFVIVNENDGASTRYSLRLYVRAVDKNGRKGEWIREPAYINMDSVSPELDSFVDIGGYYLMSPTSGSSTKDLYVAVTVHDNKSTRVSGIKEVKYTINGTSGTTTKVLKSGGYFAVTKSSGNLGLSGVGVFTYFNNQKYGCGIWNGDKYMTPYGPCHNSSNWVGDSEMYLIKMPDVTSENATKSYEVRAYAVDKAGNKSSTKGITVDYDYLFNALEEELYTIQPSPFIPEVHYKPVLYLYPEKTTNVNVTFEHPELLTTTYPKFVNSWNVKATKDGNLTDKNGRNYYALYWEESRLHNVDFSEGFYVEGKDAIKFLEEKLEIIGLNERESNEFIMYWLPILENNQKSLVYFELTEEKEAYNKLIINPKPDSMLRITMHVKKVDSKTKIKEQKLESFNRTGFSAVEWGGTIYN